MAMTGHLTQKNFIAPLPVGGSQDVKRSLPTVYGPVERTFFSRVRIILAQTYNEDERRGGKIFSPAATLNQP